MLYKKAYPWYNVVMYLRVSSRTNKDGSKVEYVQLAHNYRDPETKTPKAKILYNFGRREEVDEEALRRLVKSICRFLKPEDVKEVAEELGEDWPFEFLGAKQLGGVWVLDKMWNDFGIGKVIKRLLKKRQHRLPIERLLFAMVANRALSPASKLAVEPWVKQEVCIDGLEEVEVHQLYRAMDFLLEAEEELQKEVFFEVANLFNLEVDVIFLDTTTTYFEIDREDQDIFDESGEIVEEGYRRYGRPKADRPRLPEVVIAFAVTRNGIPVRCWNWPGATSDQNILEEVKRDLNKWRLGRVITVADTGFNSEKNRRILQGAGGHYITGEKLSHGSKAIPAEALQRGGNYRGLENGLKIKEVVVGNGVARRRFVVAFNPEEAEKQQKEREEIVIETKKRLEALKQLDGEPHRKEACALRAHAVLGRYIRQTKTGKLRLNKVKIKDESKFDGKFIVTTSDDTLSPEDVVMGYKQLNDVERVFLDLKHTIDIRPVFHRIPDRIKAHVLLCWIAILLIRLAENKTDMTWRKMKEELNPLQVGIHRTKFGEVWQTNPLTNKQKDIFRKLRFKQPPRLLKILTGSDTSNTS